MAKPNRNRIRNRIRNRTRTIGLIAAAIGSGALILTAPAWGSYLGRRVAWFDVDRVEISGASLLPPHEVLRASTIRSGNSILDEHAAWEEALRDHPVIADARVTVRLPSTLRVRIVEEKPVALVGRDLLEPVTAAGDRLPLDPGAARLDLPIVAGSLDDPETADALRLTLAETGRLADLDPELMRGVSEVGLVGAGGQILQLRHLTGVILLPMGMDAARLLELRAVLDDVPARVAPSGPGDSPIQIDLRFQDQIVVRHSSPRELS